MSRFDAHIRSLLRDMEMPYSERVWAGIENEIRHNDQKKGYWYLFFILTFLLPILLVNAYEQERADPVVSALNDKDSPAATLMSPIPGSDLHKTAQSGIRIIQESIYTEGAFRPSVPRIPRILPQSESIDDIDAVVLDKKPTMSKISESGTRDIQNAQSGSDTLGALAPLPAIFSTFPEMKTNIQRRQNNDSSECPEFIKAYPGWYLNVYYSSDFAQRTLSPQSGESVDYIRQRKNTESSLYSFSTGLGLGYQHHSGLFAESGIHYDQINEQLHLLEEEINRTSTVITIDTLITGIDTTVVMDTSIIQMTGINETKTYNRFSHIDIPLLIGYHSYLTEDLKVNVKAGVLVNIFAHQRGQILDQSNQAFWFTRGRIGATPTFKQNIGLSYMANLTLEKSVAENLALFAGLTGRYYAQSITLDSYPIDQKYFKVGLTAGLKLKL